MKLFKIQNIKSIALFSALNMGLITSASAADIEVSVTNLTYGMYFTPLLISAHKSGAKLFEIGSVATPELEAMAEGGDISGLDSLTKAMNSVNSLNPAGGFLAPGQTAPIVMLDTADNNSLSVAAMILPSNDGFIALNGWIIPSEPGVYHVDINAYDAGTETNNELLGDGDEFIPGDPSGMSGTQGLGVTAEEVGFVHIHRGNLGDDNNNGGISDLNNKVHRWLNPVARVTVVVK